MTPEILEPAPHKRAMILQRPRMRSLPLEASSPARSYMVSFEMEFPVKTKQIPKILRLRPRLLRMHLVKPNPAVVDAPSSSSFHRVKRSRPHPRLSRPIPSLWSRSNLMPLRRSGMSSSGGRSRPSRFGVHQHGKAGAILGVVHCISVPPPDRNTLSSGEGSREFCVPE